LGFGKLGIGNLGCYHHNINNSPHNEHPGKKKNGGMHYQNNKWAKESMCTDDTLLTSQLSNIMKNGIL
jgi:hypothetical protein